MNKLLLNLVMLPSALWKSMGADNVQLRAILNTRLLLDDRSPMSMGRMNKPKTETKYTTLRNIIASLVLGFVYMFPVIVVPDRIFSLAIFFSFMLMVMTLMLITDFSNVFFDSRDKYVLFPRPVNDRTIVLARLLHVFIYLFRIVLPMSLPAWIMLGYMDGWKSALLFPLPLVMMVFMALFIVNSVYLAVLKLAPPEKFKDIMNYFQVVTSVIFFASVYLMPRFFDPERGYVSVINDYAWLRFLPSYWLAACWSWLGYMVTLPGTSFLSLLAIVFPLLCMYILVRKLAPEFSRRISGIDAADTGGFTKTGNIRRSSGIFYKKLAYLFNRSDEARAGFMIAWLQTSRSRSFRMRVYPTFAYIPVYFFYLLTSQKKTAGTLFERLANGHLNLLLLYMSAFVLISAITYLISSDQYKAAWIYYAAPVQKPGNIMTGAFKALWVKYFLPFFISLSVFVVYVWGIAAVGDIALALVNVTLFVACIARISYRQLPFSTMEKTKQRGSRVVKSFIAMIVPATLGAAHYFSLPVWWLKLTFFILSSMLLWLVLDSYANTTWDNMHKADTW